MGTFFNNILSLCQIVKIVKIAYYVVYMYKNNHTVHIIFKTSINTLPFPQVNVNLIVPMY